MVSEVPFDNKDNKMVPSPYSTLCMLPQQPQIEFNSVPGMHLGWLENGKKCQDEATTHSNHLNPIRPRVYDALGSLRGGADLAP